MMIMIIMRIHQTEDLMIPELRGSSLNDDNDNNENYSEKKKVCLYLN